MEMNLGGGAARGEGMGRCTGYTKKWTPSEWMTSVMDFFPLNCLHRTNVHTPRETKFSQMTGGLLLAHLKQTDCRKLVEEGLEIEESKRKNITNKTWGGEGNGSQSHIFQI